jgi:hypothetical protein
VKVSRFQGSYTLLCNGFPVEKMWVNIQEYDEEWAANMQTALVGEGNVASIHIRPYLKNRGTNLSIGAVQLEAWVEIEETQESYVPLHRVEGAAGEGRLRTSVVDSARAKWERRARKKWRTFLKSEPSIAEAYGRLRQWRLEHPIEVKTTEFTNRHGPDFSRIFEKAPIMEGTPADSARMRDYAMRLRDLMARKDTLALYRETKIGFTDRDTGRPRSKDRIVRLIGSNWLEEDWRLDFSRSEVGLRRWSGGRVWELYRADLDTELFVAGEKRQTGLLDVYVAQIDGELQVVR